MLDLDERFGDGRHRLAVSENLQRGLESLEVVDGEEYGFRGAVPGQRKPFMLSVGEARQLVQPCLRLAYGQSRHSPNNSPYTGAVGKAKPRLRISHRDINDRPAGFLPW